MKPILIVEDNELNREYLVELFSTTPYELRTVADGEEAVEALAREEYSIVVLDLQMPKKNGFQVLEYLRSSRMNSRTPAIALTALAMAGDEKRALAAGFDAYITKPIDSKALFSAIERLVAQKGMQ